jgi:uncharacterized protein YfbU (UPF0304 family)
LEDSLNRDPGPSLTTAERLILANQYAILAALFSNLCTHYEELRLLVEKGIPAGHADLRFHEMDPTRVSVRNAARRRRALTESADRGGALTPW